MKSMRFRTPRARRAGETRHAASGPFLAEVRRALRDCRVPAGARVHVAVSGGPDSMALLTALHRLARTFPLRLSVGHLHHGLRGRDADADRDAVRRDCRRLGIPLTSARWDTAALMRRRGLSGQAGLRTLRREFLRASAERHGAELIATGHTADDQLETMLLRLARGTGLPGLAGIRPRAGRFIRPLLGLSRAEILRFLEANDVAHRSDRSNLDLAYARNRVRRRVVPELARAQRQRRPGALAQAAARTASELRRAARLLRRRGERAFSVCLHPKAVGIRLDCEKARTYALPIRRELLRAAWARTGASRGLTLRHLDALEGLLAAPGAKARLDLPDGQTARRSGRYLELRVARAGTLRA